MFAISIQDLAAQYNDLQREMGETPGDQGWSDKINALFSEDFIKTLKGELFVKNRSELPEQILKYREDAGLWEIEEKEIISSEVISENKPIKTKMIASEDLPKICPDLPYSVPGHSSIRVVSIGDFSYQSCGGTHVKTTSELEGLTITKVKIKNKTLKINYTLA